MLAVFKAVWPQLVVAISLMYCEGFMESRYSSEVACGMVIVFEVHGRRS